jgi:hypothetical protein
MYNITRFPVIILSSPRTGSTILAHDIQEELNKQGKSFQVFNEPITGRQHDSFLSYKNKDYILKIHAHDLIKYPTHILDMIKDRSCFLIRIRRRNIENQILSWCIARQTLGWGYYNPFGIEQNLLDSNITLIVSHNQIIKDVHIIIKFNNELDEIDVKFDLDLFYEDLDFKSTHMIKAPKPINHEKIREVINNVLQGRILNRNRLKRII